MPKRKKPKFQPIKITLVFDQDDVQSILECADFAEVGADAKTMSKAAYNALKRELQDAAGTFVDEIVESSDEACANDWLGDYMAKYFPSDEDDEDSEDDR